MTEAQAVREMNAVGLDHVETLGVLPTQHLMLFRKPPEPAPEPTARTGRPPLGPP